MCSTYITSSPNSLKSTSLDCVGKYIDRYVENSENSVQYLPSHLKSILLRKCTLNSSSLKRVNFKKALKELVNSHTSTIDITNEVVDDDLLGIIKSCTNLKNLYITKANSSKSTALSPQGLIDLFSSFKNLRSIRLISCSKVTDEVIECLTKNNLMLTTLDVAGCSKLTDKSLVNLSTLQNLQGLSVSDTMISDDGITALVHGPSGPHIKELKMSKCPMISSRILSIISEKCPSMEVLIFDECMGKIDYSFPWLERGDLKNLKQVTWSFPW